MTTAMGRPGPGPEDDDDDDERFHDSIDRLLSSSNTSCSCSSASSDDDVGDPNPIFPSPCRDPPLIPRFPKGVSDNYDVWISQPSSVEERRLRLLRQMGLSRDPSLVRHRPSLSFSVNFSGTDKDRPECFGRSVSSDHVNSPAGVGKGFLSFKNSDNSNSNCISVIIRSKSEGECNSTSSCTESEIVSGDSVRRSSSIQVIETREGGGIAVNNNQNQHIEHNGISTVDKSRNRNVMIDFVSLKKSTLGRIGSDFALDRNGNSLSPATNGEVRDNVDFHGVEKVQNPVLIKDLDNGKEFVVNEVTEDGAWNKLKEVGTGRHLTMEEFQICVGTSPIVQELMRRQNVEERNKDGTDSNVNANGGGGSKSKKKGNWLKSIRNVASSVTGHKDRPSSDDRDTSSEKGGRRSNSATDDSQDSFHGPERVRVRQYGKSCKELTALYKSQEIQAHSGSIWTMKFSLDGRYLASAGEDCVIHVWQVVELERKGELSVDKLEDGNMDLLVLVNGSPEPISMSPKLDGQFEKKRRGRSSISRKSMSLDPVLVPETVFGLSEKPFCSFHGHVDDVLDLSWSKSEYLLSSSMDKTVRLWHFSSQSCLKIFSHSDYVTCIQFNPVDDRYFISGSLDAKVRLWSIPDRQVVDWNDLHEMVTAACYTPDGQGALVGSHKGSCRLYNTSENKLHPKSHVDLQNKKKSNHRKITGFQFVPGSTCEVLITSADSRIRLVDGVDLVHKFKGFRNANSQISASPTANGRYVVCASEDSHVYVWKHEGDSRPSRSKGVTVTQSYEHFHCQDVSVAIPWPGMCESWRFTDSYSRQQSGPMDHSDEVSTVNHPPTPIEGTDGSGSSPLTSGGRSSPFRSVISNATNSYLFDRISATWPEEKLLVAAKNHSPRVSVDYYNGPSLNRSAWGLVIVTAGLRGEIRTYQNFGLPVRI